MQSRELKEWMCKESWNESLRGCGIWERSRSSKRPSATTSKRAPDMVRDFYSQAKKIILEIYHAFADEEEQKKIEGELNEGDSTSKEKDKKEGNEAEGENGGSIKVKLRKVSPTSKRTKRSFIRS